jgi:hypothetical protein
LACPKIQESPVIGRLALSAAGNMPSGVDIAVILETTDLVEKIGHDVVRHQNHVQIAVIPAACLRASAAKEAGIIRNMSS